MKINIYQYSSLQRYAPIFERMRLFTLERTSATDDQLWLLEHYPVYTQGQAGKKEHILNDSNIPVVQSDRGGQVTYHGPGQMMGYVLVDLKRLKIGIRVFVTLLENTVIKLLKTYNIIANSRKDAPGVYVDKAKICSLGLRVRKGCTYHGISLNVNMDLTPFNNINPCGFKDLAITQIKDFDPSISLEQVKQDFIKLFSAELHIIQKETIE